MRPASTDQGAASTSRSAEGRSGARWATAEDVRPAHGEAPEWRLRDYRTGRKAAKVGIPAAAGVGALAGGTAAAVALHRRRR